jgi:hypothetical protein
MRKNSVRALAVTGTVAASLIALSPMPASAHGGSGSGIGPSTTTKPYVLPVAPGVSTTSLLTVNDAGAAGNGYELVGIPDGIGTRWENGKVVAYVNHELRTNNGIVRRHGQRGAFVSKQVIDPRTKKVVAGEDLIDPGIQYWNYATGAYATTPSPSWTNKDGTTALAQPAELGRFCSGYLTTPLQLVSRTSLRGYRGQIYFANEEVGDEGRVFGVTTDGQAWQLPRLGLFSWENTIAAPNRGDRTVVMGNEDAATGQVWLYHGTKTYTGGPMDKAGLTNGVNTVLDTVNQAVTTDAEFRTAYPKGTPAAVTFNEVDWTQGGAAQNAEAAADGLTLNRIEDGAFDPNNRNDYYFVTTVGGAGTTVSTDPVTGVNSGRDGGGLWRLRFADVDRPELGGTLTLLLDGSEPVGAGGFGLNNPDNLTIDDGGNLLIQEDPGANVHLARIVAYRIRDAKTAVVAQFDPARFGRDAAIANPPEFFTMDEESSGIVTTDSQFGRGTYLFDAQVHSAKNLPPGTGPGTVEEYVENGQLLLLRVGDWKKVYR